MLLPRELEERKISLSGKSEENERHHQGNLKIVIIVMKNKNDIVAKGIRRTRSMLLSRKMRETIDSFLDNNYYSYDFHQ